MTKISYTADGTILAVGQIVTGKEIDETTFPDDFMNTFSLGKYKAHEAGDGTVSIVAVPGFIMPGKNVYTVEEIQQMNNDELLALQVKLQAIIDQKP